MPAPSIETSSSQSEKQTSQAPYHPIFMWPPIGVSELPNLKQAVFGTLGLKPKDKGAPTLYQEETHSVIHVPESVLDPESLRADILGLTQVIGEKTDRNELRFAIRADSILLGSRRLLPKAVIKELGSKVTQSRRKMPLETTINAEDNTALYGTNCYADYVETMGKFQQAVFSVGPKLGRAVVSTVFVPIPSSEETMLFGSPENTEQPR
jgi:hypothetical protein